MRILQVVHGYPPQKWGGVELLTATLTQALTERGHQVTVFARMADTTAEEFSVRDDDPGHSMPAYNALADADEPKVRVVRVVNNLSRISHFRLGYDNPFLDEAFHRLLTEVRPDVVHIQHVGNLSGSLIHVSAQLGYPVVLSLHDFLFACSRHYLIDNQTRLCPGPDRGERCIACLESVTSADEARRRFAYFEQLLHIPQQVIVPSRFLADRMRDIFPFLEPRLHVVAPGIVPGRQIEREERNTRQPSPLRVLCIGMLMPHKGPHVLIEAVRGLPVGSLAVSLYGGRLAVWNAYADQLETDAADLPIRFYGTYAHHELSAILARHDVLVVPSICEETFSLVTREALQAGLPVIAAKRGALPAVIQDGVNGLLFEPENADDLRRCLERLRTDTRLREQLTPASTPIRDPQAYAQDMEAVYEAVRDKSPEHQRGKTWLEGQLASWRNVAETQNDLIRELKGWIEELETGKAWLEKQRTNWQAQAEERERVVQEQQAWIGELERGKAWLEEQRAMWQAQTEHWQAQTRQWQSSFWGRLGRLLKMVNPAQAFPAKESEPDD